VCRADRRRRGHRPALLAISGVALEQQPVHFHDPVDAFDVDRRTALFLAPPPDQGVHPPLAVSRLTGDHLFDLSQQLGLGPAPAPATRCSCRRLGDEVRARHPKRIGDRLHGLSSRTGEGARNSRFFGCARSSASRRISFSRVFLPNSRCSHGPDAAEPGTRRLPPLPRPPPPPKARRWRKAGAT
jgi:hypothetical protein